MHTFLSSVFWSFFLSLQTRSLFSFLFVPLQKTGPSEINSRVANMKHILSTGAGGSIGCQFFQATIWHALSDSGCCSVLKKCVWVGDPVTPEVPVCVCVFQHACLQKHAMGRFFLWFQKTVWFQGWSWVVFLKDRNMWLLFISFSQTHSFGF